MSWRDTTPEPVQDDLDRLLDAALNAARHLLEQHGELYPFALALDDGGEESTFAADAGEEHPSSQALLDMLYSAAAQDRERLRAVAFVAPVATDTGDAVRAELEHRDGGPAMAILLPYARRRLRKTLDFGDLSAGAAQRRIWQ